MLHDGSLECSALRASETSHVCQAGSGLLCPRFRAVLPPMTAASRSRNVLQPDPSWKKPGTQLWFDPKAKKVILRARVVLREGYLEHFMCSKGTKEHEAILATDAVPHQIHAGLLLTGAEAGHPVRFVPKFEPPTGTRRSRSSCEWRKTARPTSRMLASGSRTRRRRLPWRSTGFSPAASSTKIPPPRSRSTPPTRGI